MSVNYEKIGPARGKIEFSIPKEDVKAGLDQVFNQVKKNLVVPGFRKGRVPRKIFNQMYGEEALYEDTLNNLLPSAYEEALKEAEVEPVGQPEMDIQSMEKGKDWEISAEFPLKPEVELGDYKELEIPKFDREVTEEDLEASLEKERQNLAELVVQDKKAESGDTVVIDYVGEQDGEEFDGGSAKNYSLELGSNSFIPGFEDQLVGTESGDEVDVTVTFPEEYHAEDLAGKEAVFHVTVHEVKTREVPELDDDFAMDVDEDVDSLDELKEKRLEQLKEQKADFADDQAAEAALAKAVENAEIEDIPEAMIEEEANRLLQLFLGQMQQQGLSPEMYFNMTGMSQDEMRDHYKDQAEENVALNLVLGKIIEAEGLTAEEDEFAEEINALAEQYNMPKEQVEQILSKDLLEHDILTRKAIELVSDSAKEVLEPEDEEDSENDEE